MCVCACACTGIYPHLVVCLVDYRSSGETLGEASTHSAPPVALPSDSTGHHVDSLPGAVSPDDEQPRPSIADDDEGSGLRKNPAGGKVLAVAEGLEEELFVAEAHRHDAEVCIHGLLQFG